MWIVAVAALDQALVHAMVEGHIELRLLLQMAGIAKRRLGLDQQELFSLRVMGRMTRSTTDIIFRVQGIQGIHVLRAGGVTRHAAVIHFFWGMILEDEDLCYVTAAGDVVRPGTVTSLTSLV